jgi:hypothetical protein
MLLTCQGRKKWLPVVLEDHLDLAEAALRAGEETVAAVEAARPPAFTRDPTACRRCWAFGTVCQPPVEEQGAILLDEGGELHELLMIEAETEEAHKRYEAAKKRRKALLAALVPAAAFAAAKRGETFYTAICGRFGIAIKKNGRKGYTVAAVEWQEAEIIEAGSASQEVA